MTRYIRLMGTIIDVIMPTTTKELSSATRRATTAENPRIDHNNGMVTTYRGGFYASNSILNITMLVGSELLFLLKYHTCLLMRTNRSLSELATLQCYTSEI